MQRMDVSISTPKVFVVTVHTLFVLSLLNVAFLRMLICLLTGYVLSLNRHLTVITSRTVDYTEHVGTKKKAHVTFWEGAMLGDG